MPQSHTVTIHVDSNGTPHPGDQRVLTARKDDTITFRSPSGKVQIHILMPFGSGIDVAGDIQHRVVVDEGRFPYKCGVIQADGTVVGWPKNPDLAGGEMVIVRR